MPASKTSYEPSADVSPSADRPLAAMAPAAAVQGPESHESKLRQTQKYQDGVGIYFHRKLSRHLTPVFLRLGFSANQATAVWGLINLVNSWIVYLALTGDYLLVAPVFGIYVLSEVIDCVDGEIARYRGTASPIGGKLLDGVWHQATEYSLLTAYVAAVTRTPELPAMALGLALLTGEAMYTYVYERRLTVIRVFAKSTEYINPTTADDLYTKDEAWSAFPTRKKLKALKGLAQHKSVYVLVALSAVSPRAFAGGLAVLAAYKHYVWIRLLVRTVNHPPKVVEQ